MFERAAGASLYALRTSQRAHRPIEPSALKISTPKGRNPHWRRTLLTLSDDTCRKRGKELFYSTPAISAITASTFAPRFVPSDAAPM